MTHGENQQESRAANLIDRYQKYSWGLERSPEGFVDFLIDEIRPTVKSSTWRVYRSAGADYLETIGESPAAWRLREMRGRGNNVESRTSALKLREVPRTEFFQLCTYLLRFSRSKFSPALRHWLIAGVATGLRPCEWETARLSGNFLFVENAKHDDVRANGPTRTLDLSPLSDIYRVGINCHMMNVEGWSKASQFGSSSDKAASLLTTVRRKYPSLSSLSLYSLRHQFASNSKALHNRLETSALLGHATSSSASGYGRKEWAWPQEMSARDFPMPIEKEVAGVRDDVADRIRHLKERREIDLAGGL